MDDHDRSDRSNCLGLELVHDEGATPESCSRRNVEKVVESTKDACSLDPHPERSDGESETPGWTVVLLDAAYDTS